MVNVKILAVMEFAIHGKMKIIVPMIVVKFVIIMWMMITMA